MIQARLAKRFAAGPDSAPFSLDVELRSSAPLTALFGPDGAGKTLVLDSIAGFSRPDAGRILLDDEILFDAASGLNLPARRRNCSYLFRHHSLFPHMTLRENLMFAVEQRPRLERHRRVNETLERFNLAGVSSRRAGEVTAADRQRASLARAIIGGPCLLLLDQPSDGLEPGLRSDLHALLRQVRDEFKLPILLATADLEECCDLADEMLILRDGRILQAAPPGRILDQPASVEVARLLGVPNLFQAEVVALDPARDTSRLRFQDCELNGAYFPGRLLGDRVWLCVRPDALRLSVHNGSKPGLNQMRARLLRVSEKPRSLRLEFSGDISAEISREAFVGRAGVKDWLIEFPSDALRVL